MSKSIKKQVQVIVSITLNANESLGQFSISDEVWTQLSRQVRDQVWYQVGMQIWGEIWDQVRRIADE